ncbi:TadE/TadG family type IV pilus assembly protein [Butyrivibrio sp. JL13D10]|uniref:TadE/TadG family type IV pilus assembly protein n=1 Tax=Butyrivibrio sp. JL13D10 TaxID=3236815 RepID=UPI0038B460CD
MKTTKLLNKIKDDRGYIIMESSFVFPIMFFIVAFLIFAGNMFMLKARIHSEVSKEAIIYANYFSNPLIESIEADGYKVKTKAGADLTNHLYRYLFKHGRYADNNEVDDLKTRISKIGLFGGTTPDNIIVHKHDVNRSVLYHTYIVEVEYTLAFPIKMIFDDNPWVLQMSAREEAPVTDQSEFIRNVDMTIDFLEHKPAYNTAIEEWSVLVNNITEFLSSDIEGEE